MKVNGVHNYGKRLTRDLPVTPGGNREGEGVIDRLSRNAAAASIHETNIDRSVENSMHRLQYACLLSESFGKRFFRLRVRVERI